MLNEYELRNRMNSIGETQKITGAMYLIASNELRRAKAAYDETRPYFDALRTEIKRIFRSSGYVESRYYYPADGDHLSEGTYGILAITADKGLAGSYNMNVIKETEKALAEHPNSKLFVVGNYGRKYFAAKNIPFEEGFLYSAQSPTLHRARKITSILLSRFGSGELAKLFVIYTNFKNEIVTEVQNERILPFHRHSFFSEKELSAPVEPFKFFPSEKEVLEAVVPSYVCGFIYSALVNSFCCEQRSRMAAMQTADQSARDMLEELDFEYNRLRQSEITREITEISAAARFQKEKAARAARSDKQTSNR